MTSSAAGTVRLSAEQKLAAVRDHLLNKVPVSEICSKYQCAPSVFYKWQNDLLTGGASVLEAKKNPHAENRQISAAEQRVAKLQATLTLREQAIAELVADNIRLKKIQNGET